MPSSSDHPNPIPLNDDVSSPSSSSFNDDVIPSPTSSSFNDDVIPPSSSTSVTIASIPPKRPPSLPPTPKPPLDDCRRLFQRLWTDDDEIELLQGFLDYTSSRGGGSHHHDTTAFYDLIKSKLQLDFNKNQLVEKLRRLKKKYRNVLNKMGSGKDFVFKSPHDQITFELSRKIWTNLNPSKRGGVGASAAAVAGVTVAGFDDDDDPSPNPNLNNPNSNLIASSGVGGGGVYYVSHFNLNNAANVDQKPNFGGMMASVGSPSKLSTRKRERERERPRVEDKYVRVNLVGSSGSDGVNVNANPNVNLNNLTNNNSISTNVQIGPSIQGLIEETVKNSLSPMFKELIDNAMNANANVNGSGIGRIKGVGSLAMNAMPLNFAGINFTNGGEIMDEKWRKQQILELEVYSKRLELVQDQIKLALDELRSIGG